MEKCSRFNNTYERREYIHGIFSIPQNIVIDMNNVNNVSNAMELCLIT